MERTHDETRQDLLYQAYVEAALAGERTGFERQLAARGPVRRSGSASTTTRTAGRRRGPRLPRDLRRRRPAEAAGARGGRREHRLRLVTDSVGSPIVHFDRQLKLRFANKPFGDWVGVAPDDLLGRGMPRLIAGGTFADMDEHIERAFGGAKVSFERRERKATASCAGSAHAVPRPRAWPGASAASSP